MESVTVCRAQIHKTDLLWTGITRIPDSKDEPFASEIVASEEKKRMVVESFFAGIPVEKMIFSKKP